MVRDFAVLVNVVGIIGGGSDDANDDLAPVLMVLIRISGVVRAELYLVVGSIDTSSIVTISIIITAFAALPEQQQERVRLGSLLAGPLLAGLDKGWT